jgi:hypothetical protein
MRVYTRTKEGEERVRRKERKGYEGRKRKGTKEGKERVRRKERKGYDGREDKEGQVRRKGRKG